MPIELAATDWVRSGHDTLDELAPNARKRRKDAEGFEIGSVIGGRYQIDRFVAAGAFGAVYRASDLDVAGHTVALKVMHRPARTAEERQMQLREVQLIAAVSHPSVVSFKDYGLHRERLYIVMPWYEGETLASRVSMGEPLSRKEARRIFTQLAQALDAIHARGIRHQDVKPENILLARFGVDQEPFPVLLDLGVGAYSHEVVPAFTPAYVAPEMARAHLEIGSGGSTPVDGRADVFALALTLFDSLLPGARERAGDSSIATLIARAQFGVKLPPHDALRDIAPSLERWLGIDPEARPSALAFAQELSILTRAEERRAERRRALLRVGPVLSVLLCMAGVLAVELRDERVASRVKDATISEQAAQIDDVRDTLGELGGVGKDRVDELVRLRKERDSLAQQLVALQLQNAELTRGTEALEHEKFELARSHVELLEDHALLARSGERVSQELAQLQRLTGERSAALSKSESERSRLVAQIADLSEELRALRSGDQNGTRRLEALRSGVAARAHKPTPSLELP